MKISIIGSGFVGKALGEHFRKNGHKVIFYNIRKKPGVTTDINKAVMNSEVSFVCVPTPTKKGQIDLSCIKSAITNLGRVLKKKDDYHVIVIKSTVIPGTTRNVIKPLLEKTSGKKLGKNWDLYMNPEFVTEKRYKDKSRNRTIENPDRIVIGGYFNKDILDLFPNDVPIFLCSWEEAELIKYVANYALASKISFWNEIFLICREMKIDPQKISDIVCIDKRIGKYGSKGGKAYGGKCLPKDVEAFMQFLLGQNIFPVHLMTTYAINELMRKKYGVMK